MSKQQKIAQHIRELYHNDINEDKCYLLYFEFPFSSDGFYFKIAKFFNYFMKNPIDHVAIIPSKKQNDENIKILEATLDYGVIRSALVEKLFKIGKVKLHLQTFNYPFNLQKYFEFRTKVIDKQYSKLEALVSGVSFFDIFFNTKKNKYNHSYFCSELAAEFLLSQGVAEVGCLIRQEHRINKISPNELMGLEGEGIKLTKNWVRIKNSEIY